MRFPRDTRWQQTFSWMFVRYPSESFLLNAMDMFIVPSMFERVTVTIDQGLEKEAMREPKIRKKTHDKSLLVTTFVPSYMTHHRLANTISFERRRWHQCSKHMLFLGDRLGSIVKKQNNKWWCLFAEASVAVAHDRLGTCKLQSNAPNVKEFELSDSWSSTNLGFLDKVCNGSSYFLLDSEAVETMLCDPFNNYNDKVNQFTKY